MPGFNLNLRDLRKFYDVLKVSHQKTSVMQFDDIFLFFALFSMFAALSVNAKNGRSNNASQICDKTIL